jgi:hypothetical protein
MPRKSIVVCLTCDTTLVLPDESAALAQAVTDFVDEHNRMQHWQFELIPPSDISDPGNMWGTRAGEADRPRS